MNSQKHEEVRKRRAKSTNIRFNLYQKMVLTAGGLTLFSLALGINPRLGPLVVAGVIAGMMVLFLIFKTRRRKRESECLVAQQEFPPGGEESVDSTPIPDDFPDPDAIPEKIGAKAPQEMVPPQAEEAPEEKELIDAQELPGQEILAQILSRLETAEEKVSDLEDRIMDLAGKVAN